jgi:hypothetical protein
MRVNLNILQIIGIVFLVGGNDDISHGVYDLTMTVIANKYTT